MKKIVNLVLFFAVFALHVVTAMEQAPFYEILAKEKFNEHKEREKRHGRPFDVEEYPYWLQEYKTYEGYLEKIKHTPEVSVWGGVNYAMTLEEMKQKIKATFSGMKKNGLIISKDKFESIKDKYFEVAQTDLNRIWGVEYLKNKISASPILSKIYDVPQYIIVADDPHKMSVTISFRDKIFPMVKELNKGKIYFEKITGAKVASWYSRAVNDIGVKSGIGYDDFTDSGNIIRQSGSNKDYIVDTEYKSFKMNISDDLQEILEYALKRFKYLNPGKYQEIYGFDL